MEPTPDQKKRESSAKPKSGKTDGRGNQPADHAAQRRRGEAERPGSA